MTGFLLTAKQKLMLCINKRLYRPDRPHRSDGNRRCGRRHRRYRSDRPHWTYRSYRSDWTAGR